MDEHRNISPLALPNFQRHVVPTGDINLSVISGGAGPALLFVPGFGMTGATFARQLEAFVQTNHVITYDPRGIGESDIPGHGYSTARFALDLDNILCALDLEEVTLVAHSLGCAVAWAHWELGQEVSRIIRYVFIDRGPALVRLDTDAETDKDMSTRGAFGTVASVQAMTRLLRKDYYSAVKSLMNAMLSADAHGEEIEMFVHETMTMPSHIAERLYLATRFEDWGDTISTINLPSLVIAGTESMVPLNGSQWVADTLVDGRLIVVDKGSHMLHWERHDEVNAAIRAHLATRKV